MSKIKILKVMSGAGMTVDKGYIRPDEAWVLVDALKLLIPAMNVSSMDPTFTYEVPLTANVLNEIATKETIVIDFDTMGTDELPLNGDDTSVLIEYPEEVAPGDPVAITLFKGKLFDDPILGTSTGTVGLLPVVPPTPLPTNEIIFDKHDNNVPETLPSRFTIRTEEADGVAITASNALGTATSASMSRKILNKRIYGTDRQLSFRVVADITERDLLANTQLKDTIVMVNDASDDLTVDAGKAAYFWNQTTDVFDKVFDSNQMDAEADYADLMDSPASDVLDIDGLVTSDHPHANDLGGLSESVDGFMTYNNKTLGKIQLIANEW
jgi:hypothetical protein